MRGGEVDPPTWKGEQEQVGEGLAGRLECSQEIVAAPYALDR